MWYKSLLEILYLCGGSINSRVQSLGCSHIYFCIALSPPFFTIRMVKRFLLYHLVNKILLQAKTVMGNIFEVEIINVISKSKHTDPVVHFFIEIRKIIIYSIKYNIEN